MIRNLFSHTFIGLVALFFLAVACNGTTPQTSEPGKNIQADFASAAIAQAKDTIPDELDDAKVGFRDFNQFNSNGLFCVVSLVDNLSDDWRKIWLRAEFLDADGHVLTINGDSSITVKTFSDAVPPRGATAVFLAVPLNQVSGTPVHCRLAGAGSIRRPPGPIMFASEIGGVRAMYATKEDPTKVVETQYQLQATLENPLTISAYRPRMVLLIYGKDFKLYFAQMVSPENPNIEFMQEREGPLQPQEKRKITCMINYETLPQQLKDLLIGRVAVQMYEAR